MIDVLMEVATRFIKVTLTVLAFCGMVGAILFGVSLMIMGHVGTGLFVCFFSVVAGFTGMGHAIDRSLDQAYRDGRNSIGWG